MKIDALICLLVVMVTVRESLAVEDAVINVETALSPKAFVADEHVSHTYARGDVSHTYARGAGRIPDKRPCPEGLRDDGVSCWRDAHIYGKGCCCTIWGCCKNKCKSGYHDDGCTCRRTDIGIKVALWERQYCRDDEEKRGALCYPKCKAGYTPVGCCLCETVQE